MAGFSSALKLVDLNDFVTPSQVCIKPVKIEKREAEGASSVVRIEVDEHGAYAEVKEDGSKTVLQKTKITLNDCLACSGCITTAETVLVEAQSVEKFLAELGDRRTPALVVSVSPQSLASLAEHYKISVIECYYKLHTLFSMHLGCEYFFDTAFSREFSLLEQAAEFVARYQAKTQQQSQKALPLLTSACPGWVCYAEKSHGDFVLPFISTTKSPQQVMGTLVKQYLPGVLARQNPQGGQPLAPSDIFHVSIMPCFDKKLEASRDDFYNDILKSHDVDLVLTSLEIPQLLAKLNLDFLTLAATPIARPLFNNLGPHGELIGAEGGGSGGYLDFVFRYAAKQLFNVDVQQINYKTVRNADFKETILEVNGQVLLTFASAYGFRNIQNIVRQVKTNKCKYDFVEIMACPSGCLNGGAQVRPEDATNLKEVLRGVEEKYREIPTRTPGQNPAIPQIYGEFLGGTPYSPTAQQLLHTKYHHIPKMEVKNPLAIQW